MVIRELNLFRYIRKRFSNSYNLKSNNRRKLKINKVSYITTIRVMIKNLG